MVAKIKGLLGKCKYNELTEHSDLHMSYSLSFILMIPSPTAPLERP